MLSKIAQGFDKLMENDHTKHMSILSNFFLDGAKIIFGSLVVGAFVPNLAIQSTQWITIGMGITLTTAFLIAAKIASKN